MKKIKLKVKYSRLPIIADALLNYSDHCTELMQQKNIERKEDYTIRLSIATELYYTLQEKMSKRYPSETYKIPMEPHHAIVMQSTLLRFVTETGDDFKRAAIDTVKNDLNLEIVNLSTVTN